MPRVFLRVSSVHKVLQGLYNLCKGFTEKRLGGKPYEGRVFLGFYIWYMDISADGATESDVRRKNRNDVTTKIRSFLKLICSRSQSILAQVWICTKYKHWHLWTVGWGHFNTHEGYALACSALGLSP